MEAHGVAEFLELADRAAFGPCRGGARSGCSGRRRGRRRALRCGPCARSPRGWWAGRPRRPCPCSIGPRGVDIGRRDGCPCCERRSSPRCRATAMDAGREAAQQRRNALRALPPCCPSPIWTEMPKRPLPAFPLVRTAFRICTPDRIRTGATALRGRRARPLHNGGWCSASNPRTLSERGVRTKSRALWRTSGTATSLGY